MTLAFIAIAALWFGICAWIALMKEPECPIVRRVRAQAEFWK